MFISKTKLVIVNYVICFHVLHDFTKYAQIAYKLNMLVKLDGSLVDQIFALLNIWATKQTSIIVVINPHQAIA